MLIDTSRHGPPRLDNLLPPNHTEALTASRNTCSRNKGPCCRVGALPPHSAHPSASQEHRDHHRPTGTPHTEHREHREAHSAARYWTGFDLDDPVYDGFEHSVMGINWGAKRDFGTWFSPADSAVLGIQLIPMSPSVDHLTGDPDRIRTNVRDVDAGTLADYVVMYAGLAGPTDAREALERARALGPDAIDQGNSRTYLLAFLMAQARDD